MKYFFMYAMLCCAPISLCAMEEESEELHLYINDDSLTHDYKELIFDSRFTRQRLNKQWKKEPELEAVIKRGFNVNGKITLCYQDASPLVTTPLVEATFGGDVKTVKFLLNHGAAKSITSGVHNFEDSPLMKAAFNHAVDILKLFFEHNITITSSEQTILLKNVDELGSLPQYSKTTVTVKTLINEYCKKHPPLPPLLAAIVAAKDLEALEQKEPTGARKKDDKNKDK